MFYTSDVAADTLSALTGANDRLESLVYVPKDESLSDMREIGDETISVASHTPVVCQRIGTVRFDGKDWPKYESIQEATARVHAEEAAYLAELFSSEKNLA